ncbi:A-kinase anchor protein 1, mitochondrial-like [Physella acuta]|uniref:A-kinase anchor protein 1, mitochondrial-like n=1 Tax=Physella acuta TaxID=109671 RepID=UPI0027DBB39C|nr:A-kinase anchor protein 1, mitochondrial-like [Physella acuta]XP_059146073.1 A-kinase anchor protein 1, mitochondrial-like [Physella acuta]
MKDFRVPFTLAVPLSLALLGVLWIVKRRAGKKDGKKPVKPILKDTKESDSEKQIEVEKVVQTKPVETEGITLTQRKIPDTFARDRGSSDLSSPGLKAGVLDKELILMATLSETKSKECIVSGNFGQGDSLSTIQKEQIEELITSAMGDGLQEAKAVLAKSSNSLSASSDVTDTFVSSLNVSLSCGNNNADLPEALEVVETISVASDATQVSQLEPHLLEPLSEDETACLDLNKEPEISVSNISSDLDDHTSFPEVSNLVTDVSFSFSESITSETNITECVQSPDCIDPVISVEGDGSDSAQSFNGSDGEDSDIVKSSDALDSNLDLKSDQQAETNPCQFVTHESSNHAPCSESASHPPTDSNCTPPPCDQHEAESGAPETPAVASVSLDSLPEMSSGKVLDWSTECGDLTFNTAAETSVSPLDVSTSSKGVFVASNLEVSDNSDAVSFSSYHSSSNVTQNSSDQHLSPAEENKEESPAKSISPLCDNNSEGSNDSGRGGSEHDVVCHGGDSLVHFDFNMPSDLCGRFIGRQGKNINYLKSKTGANISLSNNPFTADFQICQVVGTQAEVDEALTMIRRKFPLNEYPLLTMVPINIPQTPQIEYPVIVSDVMQLSLPEGVSVDVYVSAIVDAGHVFVQQPTHRSFMSLEKLTYFLNTVYGQDPTVPCVPTPLECGIICVCENDGFWYRAMIMTPENENGEAQVKFVDYGGYAVMPVTSLKQIRTDFMSLPFQAVECFMANITPNQGEQFFSEEATMALGTMTSCKLLQCQVVARTENGIPYIHLYEINPETNSAVMINRALVNSRLVRWIEIL